MESFPLFGVEVGPDYQNSSRNIINVSYLFLFIIKDSDQLCKVAYEAVGGGGGGGCAPQFLRTKNSRGPNSSIWDAFTYISEGLFILLFWAKIRDSGKTNCMPPIKKNIYIIILLQHFAHVIIFSHYINFQLFQSGLGMGLEEYYLNNDQVCYTRAYLYIYVFPKDKIQFVHFTRSLQSSVCVI